MNQLEGQSRIAAWYNNNRFFPTSGLRDRTEELVKLDNYLVRKLVGQIMDKVAGWRFQRYLDGWYKMHRTIKHGTKRSNQV